MGSAELGRQVLGLPVRSGARSRSPGPQFLHLSNECPTHPIISKICFAAKRKMELRL